MRKSSIGVSLYFLVFLASWPHVARADMLTPGMQDQQRRTESLSQAVMAARKNGTFQQQLDAANAFDKFCTRSYQSYSIRPLNAKLVIADIYWSNGRPAQGKQLLAAWWAGFEKAYSDGMRKIADIKAKRDAQKSDEYEVVTDFSEADFDRNFYQVGPGTVSFSSRLHVLIYLSELCKALGQSQEASTYLKMAAQVYNQNKERESRSRSWADEVDDGKTLYHGLWLSLYKDKQTGVSSAQRVAQLKLALNEAYKFGNENLCVAKTLSDLGLIYRGAEAEPLLKRALEIYWKNGSPTASRAASYYLSCMRSLNREQEGQRFLETLKAGGIQAKKQANAAGSGVKQ